MKEWQTTGLGCERTKNLNEWDYTAQTTISNG